MVEDKQIVLNQFPTHIEKTNNKVAANKFMKITNQSVYNGKMHPFTRAIVVKNMHDYIISNIPVGFTVKTPCKPKYEIYTVRNHGSIQRRGGEIKWKVPEPDYEANWDDDNLAFLWMKTIRDSLTEAGVWQDDNVDFVRGSDYDLFFVDKFEDRKIVISFIEL